MTLSINKFSITHSQHQNALHCNVCLYIECRVLLIVILNVVLLGVVMLGVVAPLLMD